MIQVGDWVDFKRDIEGFGVVVEIARSDWGQVEYVIAETEDSQSSEQWHPAAFYSAKHGCAVVYVDAQSVWRA